MQFGSCLVYKSRNFCICKCTEVVLFTNQEIFAGVNILRILFIWLKGFEFLMNQVIFEYWLFHWTEP